MASPTFSRSELKELFELCREYGCLKLKTADVEFELAENLPIVQARVILDSADNDIPEPGLDPAKAADLKRMREQQRALKQLFNDV